jgi:hypothetical protein
MSNIKNSRIKLPNYLKIKSHIKFKRSYHTTICNKNNFTPLAKANINNLNLNKISMVTIDIETCVSIILKHIIKIG